MYKAKEALILVLLLTGMAFSYMDRAVLGVLAPHIEEDLHLDPAQMGLALGFFSIGYTLFCLYGGVLGDKLGPKRVIGTSFIAWSALCAATGAVFSLPALLVVRFFFGMSEASFASSSAKVVFSWFSAKRYGGALGIVYTGAPLGGAVAGPVAGLLYLAFGWRMAFFVVGAIGVVWLLAWITLAQERPDPATIVETPAAIPAKEGGVGTSANQDLSAWRTITQRNVVAAALGNFALGYLLYFFLSWFPSYLSKGLHMDLKQMSMATVMPWLTGVLGVLVGGYGSDYLVRRLGDEVRARKAVIVTGLAVAGVCVALAPQFATPSSALALMSCAAFFMFMTSPNYSALARPVTPDRHFATMIGFVVFLTNVAGILAPIITGFLVKATGAFNAAFVLAGAVVIGGAVAVAFLAQPARKPLAA